MVESIIKTFEIWTDAQGLKSKGRVKSIENISLVGISRLRELILKLAVRGKLVNQIDGDESAHVLLEKIHEEKRQIIKGKKAYPISELQILNKSEEPFDIPKDWVWVKLDDIFLIEDNLRVPVNSAERNSRKGIYPYYGANGQVGTIDNYIFEGERILMAEDGGFFDEPIRGVAYRVDGKFWVNNHAHVLKCLGGTF